LADLRHLVGVPFVNGGRDPKAGLDCWGVIMAASRCYGWEVPDFRVGCKESREIDGTFQREVAGDWREVGVPTEGCVLAFAIDPEMPDAVQHFGVYVGKGRFLHTLEKSGSIVSRIDHFYWRNKLRGVYEWVRQPLSA
jgi:cell wall-associated NlpC family hydrolase